MLLRAAHVAMQGGGQQVLFAAAANKVSAEDSGVSGVAVPPIDKEASSSTKERLGSTLLKVPMSEAVPLPDSLTVFTALYRSMMMNAMQARSSSSGQVGQATVSRSAAGRDVAPAAAASSAQSMQQQQATVLAPGGVHQGSEQVTRGRHYVALLRAFMGRFRPPDIMGVEDWEDLMQRTMERAGENNMLCEFL
jgi:hypothetical protein